MRCLREGIDPIAWRREADTAAARWRAASRVFREVAEFYIGAHEAGWRSPTHRKRWRSTFMTYAGPRTRSD